MIPSSGKPAEPHFKYVGRHHRFARHRRLVAMIAPGVVAYIFWWGFVIANPSILASFTEVTGVAETPNWYMCVTMAFGSMIAGATSEVSAVGCQAFRDDHGLSKPRRSAENVMYVRVELYDTSFCFGRVLTVVVGMR